MSGTITMLASTTGKVVFKKLVSSLYETIFQKTGKKLRCWNTEKKSKLCIAVSLKFVKSKRFGKSTRLWT